MQPRNGVGSTAAREGGRPLSLLLTVIGLIAMATSMYMGARFGWSLSEDIYDRSALAMLHLLADPGAGALAVAGGAMLRLGWMRSGAVFIVFAIILVLWSITNTFGFMSASRVAATMGHDRVLEFDRGRLAWTENSSVSSDVAKGDRRLLKTEAKELGQRIRAELRVVPDAQAAAIAAALGVSTERVQKVLVGAASSVAQIIKFATLMAAGLLWPRAEPASKTQASSVGSEGEFKPRPQLVPAPRPPAKLRTEAASSARVSNDAPTGKLSAQQALHVIRQDLESGRNSSTRALALTTGWSQTFCSRAQRRMRVEAARTARWHGGGGEYASVSG